MLDLGLALAGLLTVLVAWGTYLATVPSGKVPLRPVGTVVLQLAGAGLGIAGVVMSVKAGGPTAAVVAPAVFALIMGSLFIILLSLAKTPKNEIQFAVGKTLPAFTASTSDGEPFDTASLKGKRVLLKFFRGGW